MDFELQASTEPGKRMVELAEKHASDFAVTAAEHDRNGTFPVENISALKKSGFAGAAVPKEFGGMGVTSIHDCVVAMNRLGVPRDRRRWHSLCTCLGLSVRREPCETP